jgi:CBS domain-containing protein
VRAGIEFHAARGAILDSPDAVLEHGYVVRRGSVELMIEGRLIDLIGEGEIFGFVSLLSEGPPGFVARAAEDTLVYRIPAAVMRPVLERPAFVRFVTEVMNRRVRLLARHETEPPASSAGRPVGELIRAPALVCPPATSVREAARQMAEAGATCVVVDTGDGLGISSDRTGTEALLEMLSHGIRHRPVLAPNRRLLGVLDNVDLMANERRAPFHLRASIARSSNAQEVAEAAAELPDMVIALFDAGLTSAAISRTITSIHDSVTPRRSSSPWPPTSKPAASRPRAL